jgi:hypothetical protein
MTPQLTLMQLWALLVGGPLVMILTAMVGIFVNVKITAANLSRLEPRLTHFEEAIRSELRHLESQ